MNATKVLAGRREGELLAFPSVRRMADILAQRCREPSWVRTSVASLERFRTLTGHSDLELLLQQALDLDVPLIAQSNGSHATPESVARARRRGKALIRAGSDVNIALCRTTGDFFREWGLPGSRFDGPEDLNIEEYI